VTDGQVDPGIALIHKALSQDRARAQDPRRARHTFRRGGGKELAQKAAMRSPEVALNPDRPA